MEAHRKKDGKTKKTAKRYTAEDDKVFQIIYEKNMKDYNKTVAELRVYFPSRDNRSIKEHLRRFAPEDYRPFTKEDDEKMLELHNKLGNKWVEIARGINRKNGPMVRTRCLNLMKWKKDLNEDNNRKHQSFKATALPEPTKHDQKYLFYLDEDDLLFGNIQFPESEVFDI